MRKFHGDPSKVKHETQKIHQLLSGQHLESLAAPGGDGAMSGGGVGDVKQEAGGPGPSVMS